MHIPFLLALSLLSTAQAAPIFEDSISSIKKWFKCINQDSPFNHKHRAVKHGLRHSLAIHELNEPELAGEHHGWRRSFYGKNRRHRRSGRRRRYVENGFI
jgi:hypothetical protein